MKIVHVLASGGWGGCERLACALARRARDDGHAVFVEAAPECRQGFLADAPDLASTTPGERGSEGAWTRGHEGPPPPLRRAAALWRWSRAAHRRVAQLAPDLVHVHLSTPAFAGAASVVVGGLPAVWTFQLLPEAGWPLDFMTRTPCSWPLHLALRHPRQRLVAVSRADASALTDRFGSAVVRCVPNSPPPAQRDPDPVRADVWGDAGLKLVSVGRLVPQKGFARLIVALAAPALRGLPFRWVIVGDGPERTALERSVIASGLGDRVVWLGGRPAHSALRHADFLLAGSLYEGMPLVPMEAVLEGCGVIASPIAPHRELFDTIPDSLLPDDVEAWPMHLAAVLGDAGRRQRLRSTQASLREQFGPERFYAEYATLYAEIAGSPQGSTRGEEAR